MAAKGSRVGRTVGTLMQQMCALKRFPLTPIRQQLLPAQITVSGHMDLEGVCVLKIVRTGVRTCAVMDVTGETLRARFTDKEIQRLFWAKPAALKWRKKAPRKGRRGR